MRFDLIAVPKTARVRSRSSGAAGPWIASKPASIASSARSLADRQVVGDQRVDRDIECVKNPLRGEIQGDDLSIDAPDTSTDLEGTHPVVQEVPKQLGPSSTFRARAIPRGEAARPVIPALRQRWVGDRRDPVSRIALVPDTERARCRPRSLGPKEGQSLFAPTRGVRRNRPQRRRLPPV